MNAQPELLPPVTPPPPSVAEPVEAEPSVAERMMIHHDLPWLAPLFKDGNTKRHITPKSAASILTCSLRHVYELIGLRKIETIKVGSDYRVMKRSVMVHLWESWSGRHTALPKQIEVFILTLLSHLPAISLQTIGNACAHLIARKAAAEHSLGLNKAPSSNKRQRTTELPLD